MRGRDWLRFSRKIADPALGILRQLGLFGFSIDIAFAPAEPDWLSLAPVGGKIAMPQDSFG
jgi:hypothetical protein